MICVVLPVILCNHMNTSICYISDNCQSINLNINLSINSKLLFQEKYNEPKKEIQRIKKNINRENLNGRYRLSMSVFLTVTLINLFSDLPFTYRLGNVYATKVQTVIYYIAEVLLSIVVGVLQMGLIRFHLNMARKKECRISDVFYCFMNHSNRYFGAYIIYYAISMIAKAPFLVARNFFKLSGDTMGIAIALYAASAVLSFIVLVLFPFYLYLVLSRDDLSVFACLTHAIKLIRGNILRVIYINVSFIGMLVLCVLSLGIGLLWVEPYYEQTFTNLFLDVTGELPAVDCMV